MGGCLTLAELGALDVESEMSVALRSVTSSCTCACGIMLPPAMTDVEVVLDCQGQRISVEREEKAKGALWRPGTEPMQIGERPQRSSRPREVIVEGGRIGTLTRCNGSRWLIA